LALGLSDADLQRALPGVATVKEQQLPSQMVERLDRPEYAGISNSDLHWHTLLMLPALPETGADRNAALAVVERGPGRIVLCQAAPWLFDYQAKPYVRTTYRRDVFLVARLLCNLGASSQAPTLERLTQVAPVYQMPLTANWRGQFDKDDSGEKGGWQQPAFDDTAWAPIKAGATFQSQLPELAKQNGIFWYRLRFRTPPGLSRDKITLWLGPVDDESKTWLNGKFLGEVNKQTNPKDYWSFPRVYSLSEDLLYRDRENVLVVRCLDTFQSGGITAEPRLTARPPWLSTYYLQTPEAVDDPYRYYRW
jgi:beta-galactosidase